MARILSNTKTQTGGIARVVTKDRKIAITTIRKENNLMAKQITGAWSGRNWADRISFYYVTWSKN